MIKIHISDNHIEISGHANYDEYGKDIVCSSVSSIVITTVNAIFSFGNDLIEYNDNKHKLTITKLKDSEISNKLIDNMINMLKDLVSDYPKYIKIIEKR